MKKILLLLVTAFLFASCGESHEKTVSSSGVERATTEVQTMPNGHTIEQQNVIDRLKIDNMPGSIKHLYVISAYSGDVIMYSTVKGKVTSSGKRLTPTTVNGQVGYDDMNSAINRVTVAGNTYATDEVIQDDGTYGSSVEYLYWWDSKGIYHQLYVTGGMILQISSEPLAVNKVILNLETR